jgi:hypothetical protein
MAPRASRPRWLQRYWQSIVEDAEKPALRTWRDPD